MSTIKLLRFLFALVIFVSVFSFTPKVFAFTSSNFNSNINTSFYTDNTSYGFTCPTSHFTSGMYVDYYIALDNLPPVRVSAGGEICYQHQVFHYSDIDSAGILAATFPTADLTIGHHVRFFFSNSADPNADYFEFDTDGGIAPTPPSPPPSPVCTVDCFSNVLFLPGLEASRLYTQGSDGNEDQLWEPGGNSDVEALYLNPDGTSKNGNIYTRDIIDLGHNIKNIYKSFSDTVNGLVSNQKINTWKEYAYDWRQDVQSIVDNGTKYQTETISLVDTLQSLVDSSKSGKATIVAHSNGGLIAKALLKKLQDDKNAGINNLVDNVDVLILVAVPEIGTSKAVPAVLHGYDQRILFGFLQDETHARELGRNMLSAFGLLPSREYINRVSASPVTFVDTIIPSNVTTKLVQAFGSAINSYDEYKSFLLGGEGRTDPAINQTNLPISLSPNLFAKAESLHNSIDAWIPPTSMRVIEVAGWGLDTIASFEYYPKLCTASVGCGFTLDERPRFTSDGDGTVVVPSAQYTSFVSNTEKYWLNLLNTKNDHTDILESSHLLSFISNTVQKLPLDSSLSTIPPTDSSSRLRLSIHSPVTLDAYDAESNHTGKICPPNSDFCYAEENILNSSYLEFGAKKLDTTSDFEDERVRSPSPAIGGAGLRFATASPSLWQEMKRILMLSGE